MLRPLIKDKDYIMGRMAKGVFNCEVLIREIQSHGYVGGILLGLQINTESL